MLLLRIAATTARTDLPIVGVRGFPITDLAGLYCMDGSDTTGAIRNWAPGGSATAIALGGAAGDSATLMSGGGVRLQATANLPGPVIDFTQPWTAVWHGRVEPPLQPGGPSPWTTGFMGMSVSPTRGMIVFQTIGTAYPDIATPLNLSLRQSANGVQQAATGTPTLVGLNYGAVGSVCLRFAPDTATTGTADILFVRGGAIAVRASIQVDIAGMTKDSVGNIITQAKLVAGSPTSVYPRGSLAVETFAVYKRKLTDQDLAVVDTAGAAIRQARSR